MSNLKTNDQLSLTVTWLPEKEKQYLKKVYSLFVALPTEQLKDWLNNKQSSSKTIDLTCIDSLHVQQQINQLSVQHTLLN